MHDLIFDLDPSNRIYTKAPAQPCNFESRKFGIHQWYRTYNHVYVYKNVPRLRSAYKCLPMTNR